jgi:hypothetical protein
MPIYEESGLRITLPDGDSFRLQDCASYISLKGKNLSEMDFGWWDATKETLWLLDIKDYSHLSPSEKLPDYLLEKLIKKVTDTLLILSSAWLSNSLQGKEVCADLLTLCQNFPTNFKKLKIVFVLKIIDAKLKL